MSGLMPPGTVRGLRAGTVAVRAGTAAVSARAVAVRAGTVAVRGGAVAVDARAGSVSPRGAIARMAVAAAGDLRAGAVAGARPCAPVTGAASRAAAALATPDADPRRPRRSLTGRAGGVVRSLVPTDGRRSIARRRHRLAAIAGVAGLSGERCDGGPRSRCLSGRYVSGGAGRTGRCCGRTRRDRSSLDLGGALRLRNARCLGGNLDRQLSSRSLRLPGDLTAAVLGNVRGEAHVRGSTGEDDREHGRPAGDRVAHSRQGHGGTPGNALLGPAAAIRQQYDSI